MQSRLLEVNRVINGITHGSFMYSFGMFVNMLVILLWILIWLVINRWNVIFYSYCILPHRVGTILVCFELRSFTLNNPHISIFNLIDGFKMWFSYGWLSAHSFLKAWATCWGSMRMVNSWLYSSLLDNTIRWSYHFCTFDYFGPGNWWWVSVLGLWHQQLLRIGSRVTTLLSHFDYLLAVGAWDDLSWFLLLFHIHVGRWDWSWILHQIICSVVTCFDSVEHVYCFLNKILRSEQTCLTIRIIKQTNSIWLIYPLVWKTYRHWVISFAWWSTMKSYTFDSSGCTSRTKVQFSTLLTFLLSNNDLISCPWRIICLLVLQWLVTFDKCMWHCLLLLSQKFIPLIVKALTSHVLATDDCTSHPPGWLEWNPFFGRSSSTLSEHC